ncbi:MAG TPA: pyrimidine dimer DNA glycosylase/endonuclease V [Burkholderiaceae bacterium]|nr:pyrimidine dimer DNA glycosylase/endonuclease V [Burkholderiaceae bacterium]
MRIWTVHPKYLDPQGLVALWREALLAQKVLRGLTRGYRAHPQLERFRAQSAPMGTIGAYLLGVREEALRRGYRFDGRKIATQRRSKPMLETDGQLLYEWEHLRGKLKMRSPEHYARIREVKLPDAHPLFTIVPGAMRSWERPLAARRP